MVLYKYLFYRLYSWNLRKWGESDMPHWNALLGVSFMMAVNLAFIAAVVDLAGINIFIKDTPKELIIIIMLAVLAFNYYWLVHNRKYKKLVEEF